MTTTTTSPTMETSTSTNRSSFGAQPATLHLDRSLDDALEMLLAGGLASSVICDGSCSGLASCCVAPVGPTGTSLAA